MIRTLTLLVLLVATAAAEPRVPAPTGYQWQLVPLAPAQQPQPPAPQPRWYRSHIIAADLAAGAVLVAGIARPINEHHDLWATVPGAIAFAAFAPIVHLLHHDSPGASRSLLLRIGLPALGAYLGWAGFHCRGSECYDGTNDAYYEFIGGLTGAGVAMIVDTGWLAHERVDQPRWAPAIARTQHGTTTVGLSRAF